MNTQGVKNILIGATPNEKIVRGATYAACAGVAAGFLATKGVIALTAGTALALAGGWALLAVAVGGVALAIIGAMQARRENLEAAQNRSLLEEQQLTGLLEEIEEERPAQEAKKEAKNTIRLMRELPFAVADADEEKMAWGKILKAAFVGALALGTGAAVYSILPKRPVGVPGYFPQGNMSGFPVNDILPSRLNERPFLLMNS